MPIIIPLGAEGEITIPEKVRTHLQINNGDFLHFKIKNSEIHVQKVKTKLYFLNEYKKNQSAGHNSNFRNIYTGQETY